MQHSVFWFRRDLRLHDNAGLYHALKQGSPVIPVFIFDRNILDQLEDRDDKRVTFIYQAIEQLKKNLSRAGSDLLVFYDEPLSAFKKLASLYEISHVFTNHDYEPYAIERDETIRLFLNEKGICFSTAKDQVIFEKNEVISSSGNPYTVYTPYSKVWLEKLNEFYKKPYPSEKYLHHLHQTEQYELPTLETMGFRPNREVLFPAAEVNTEILKHYHATRDIPSLQGTSRLSVHLRFGTIGIRELLNRVININSTFVKELIWREFFMQILWQHPDVVKTSFKKQYDRIEWHNDEGDFEKWKNGMTGFPIVDAGMRELNKTGYMHNRVRMITASFLTKNLLTDWRWGETYFAEKLLDYDLALNNGNWQWAAGTGCDAAPYFRIFNPYAQAEKFDPEQQYIRHWVPQLNSPGYPAPMVDLKMSRERALKRYKAALS